MYSMFPFPEGYGSNIGAREAQQQVAGLVAGVGTDSSYPHFQAQSRERTGNRTRLFTLKVSSWYYAFSRKAAPPKLPHLHQLSPKYTHSKACGGTFLICRSYVLTLLHPKIVIACLSFCPSQSTTVNVPIVLFSQYPVLPCVQNEKLNSTQGKDVEWGNKTCGRKRELGLRQGPFLVTRGQEERRQIKGRTQKET